MSHNNGNGNFNGNANDNGNYFRVLSYENFNFNKKLNYIKLVNLFTHVYI